MKTVKYILMIAAASAAVACTDGFLEKNTNPEQAYDEQMAHDGLAVGGPLSKMLANIFPLYQMEGDSEYGSANYQVNQDLFGNSFAGYVAPTHTGWNAANTYNITNTDWYEARFKDAYTRFAPQWVTINSFREGNEVLVALADIVKVAGLHRVADTYGPIPYSSLLEAGIEKKYDSLEEVYNQMFAELDAAIDVLTNYVSLNPSAKLLEEYDNVYGGNVTSWIKFANTLRLRLALRVVYANEALALAEAQKSIDNQVGLLSAANEAAVFTPSAGAPWENPFYVIQYDFNGGDAHVGATIETYMNAYGDPRREKLFTQSTVAGRPYFGVRLGVTNGDNYRGVASRFNVSKSDTYTIMAPAEALFLQAEYALRKGDEAGAKAFYEDGVRLAFSTVGASNVATYLAGTAGVGSYVDAVASGTSYNTALTATPVSWDAASGFEQHLEQIITQKYFAIFPDGQEAWSEFRRTGYPKIIPIATNNSGGKINTSEQIRRVNYPAAEYRTNAANVAEAESLLGGKDNGGTKLWWDKK